MSTLFSLVLRGYRWSVTRRYHVLRWVPVAHTRVFGILKIKRQIKGDWAGNSYTTSGCPGTCEERLMDPSNFEVIRKSCWTGTHSHLHFLECLLEHKLPQGLSKTTSSKNRSRDTRTGNNDGNVDIAIYLHNYNCTHVYIMTFFLLRCGIQLALEQFIYTSNNFISWSDRSVSS